MSLEELQRNFNFLGIKDPFWAIFSDPEKKGNKWQAEEFFKTGEREIKGLLEHVKSLGIRVSWSKALDFGCGVGRLTQALSRYFDEVHGVDIAPSMIDLANRYNQFGNRCRYHLNDSGSLTLFADDSFDLIYSNITLQHIPPPYSRGYIREFVRVLAPSGLLLFQVPSELVRSNRVKELVKRTIPTLLGIYRRIRFGYGSLISMYGIGRQEVITILEGSGARMIEVSETQDAGRGWISYRYCATKL